MIEISQLTFSPENFYHLCTTGIYRSVISLSEQSFKYSQLVVVIGLACYSQLVQVVVFQVQLVCISLSCYNYSHSQVRQQVQLVSISHQSSMHSWLVLQSLVIQQLYSTGMQLVYRQKINQDSQFVSSNLRHVVWLHKVENSHVVVVASLGNRNQDLHKGK